MTATSSDLTDPEIDVFVHAVRSPKFPLADPPDQQEHERAVESLTAEQDRYIQGLRDLADLLTHHPEFMSTGVYHTVWASGREDMVTRAKRIGGQWEKGSDEFQFYLRRKVGPHTLEIFTSRRNVCQMVQTGTRTVEVQDPEALAAVPMVTVEEPVYEWKCPELLAEPEGDHGIPIDPADFTSPGAEAHHDDLPF